MAKNTQKICSVTQYCKSTMLQFFKCSVFFFLSEAITMKEIPWQLGTAGGGANLGRKMMFRTC